MKYVIRLTDPQYPGYTYCTKDCILSTGSHEFFSPDDVFGSELEAENHIKTMLSSGWYRPDITEDNFAVVEVRQYKGLDFGMFYYTERGYNQFKGGTK